LSLCFLSKAVYGEPVGIDKLKEVAKTVSIPVYALGGIKKENVSEVLSVGAHGVAMISTIIAADDIKKETRHITGIIASHQPPLTSRLL
jgi:thiamine-phosphate pyrophosphorylase